MGLAHTMQGAEEPVTEDESMEQEYSARFLQYTLLVERPMNLTPKDKDGKVMIETSGARRQCHGRVTGTACFRYRCLITLGRTWTQDQRDVNRAILETILFSGIKVSVEGE